MTIKTSAWVWSRPGEPGDLQLQSIHAPDLAPDELLVENRVIALNPVDWKVIASGHPKWNAGHIPGVDGMGIVVAAGEGASLKTGTIVAYHQDLSRSGSFASHTIIAGHSAFVVPEGLSGQIAVTALCPGLTAWQALGKIPVSARDILITGGGGTVGFYLVQLAVQRGYRVWTTASSVHQEQLLELGVIGVFDYKDKNWRESLQMQLGKRRLFAVFDTVNEAHAENLVPLLGYNGHIICIQDRLSRAVTPAFTTGISQHEIALNSIYGYGSVHDWQELKAAASYLMNQLVTGGLIPPKIINFEFEKLPDALADLKAAKQGGKWVATLT